MKIVQITLAALLISGFSATAQNNATIATQQTAVSTSRTVKSGLEKAYKDFQSSSLQTQDATYEKFLNLVYPVLAEKKASFVDAGNSTDQKGYEALIQSFNNLIVTKRGNNKVEILTSMQKFIDLVKN